MPTLFKRSNGIFYYVQIDQNGHRRWISTGERIKSNALKKLVGLKRERPQAKSDIRLSNFAEQLMTFAAQTFAAETAGIYRRALNAFQRHVGDIPLSAVQERLTDSFKSRRLNEVSPVTLNIELRTLRAAFNVAVRWKLVETNSFRGVRLCRIDERAPIYFSLSDFRSFIQAVKENWLRDLVVVGGFTGMRRGEMLNLQWTDVDIQRHLVTVQSRGNFRTKAGKKRIIPLNRLALAVFQDLSNRRCSEYVFNLKARRIPERRATRLFKRYVRKLNLDDRLHLHSLRHSFATWLIQDGASIYEVQKLLGHSSVKTTEIYSHLASEQLQKTVERLKIDLD